MFCNWREYDAMREEQRKCVDLIAVWVILKEGQKCGVIMSRRATRGKSSFVTLEMSPMVMTNGSAIYGYEHLRGLNGSECTREGIAKILIRNRETLKSYYDIVIPANEKVLMEHDGWKFFMSLGEYDVIRVV